MDLILMPHPQSTQDKCWQIFKQEMELTDEPIGHIAKISEDKYEGFVYDFKDSITTSNKALTLTKIKDALELYFKAQNPKIKILHRT